MKNISFYLLVAVMISMTSCKKDVLNLNSGEDTFEADQENLDGQGLPKMEFKAKAPSIPGGQEYTIDLEQWDIPNDGTDAIKTTANLQAAIDWAHDEAYSQVILPEGNYLVGEDVNEIYQGGIEIHDNTEFIFSEGAILEIDSNDKWNYCVISLDGDNIIIRDGIIQGDR
ncbi:hypothetical protein D9V96_018135 [Zobellia laminariae]|uniref:hypothetical protein n=1 Tax=Zobellia laminariae TaxID=248906 RepID=UPI0012D9EDBE|nr:hypothetical protein [Zobellia laminariae]